MDSFEFNKIAGGFLGTCLFTMALGVFSDALFARSTPEKPGYDLPAAVAAPAGGAKAAPEVPFPELMAKADPKKGENDTKICSTCHSFDKDGQPKATGPNLVGVVGRRMGSTSFTGYSDGMKSKGGTWTYENINTFITNPRAFIDGTKMGYAGEKDPQRRADIIAYLRSLEDNPPPLPPVAENAPPKDGSPAPASPAPAATPAPETTPAPAAK